MLYESVDHRLGILAIHLGHHQVACLTLHQGGNLAIVRTEEQIAFPVTRYRSVLRRGWPLADRDRVADPAVIIGLLRVGARSAQHPGSPQMLQELLFQGPTSLDIEAPIDGLVGHLITLIVWIGVLEPASDLLW